ncbi:MAG: extracellular solute-binding protein [Actinobacteria bacterium]|nr:extracellular solute-binding protein [Actinomycetota bacterium]
MTTRRRRWHLLALLLALALALVAAGCGGGGDESAGGDTTAATTEEGSTEETTKEAVSGSINVLAVWTGAEGKAFQAVLDGFKEQNPDVKVSYKAAKDPGQVLATSVEGGNPPDVAALPSPGLLRDFAERGALTPIDFARDGIAENFSQSWLDLGTVKDKLYGVFFKGANKSTVWYNVAAFEDAGIEPPETFEDLQTAAGTLNSSGLAAYSIGGADGWTLTDLFENIYLRTAGPEKYDQLASHELPWTDASVTEALTEMGKIVGDKDNVAGGVSGALQTDFPTSVTQVFSDPPKAAMVFEGDFVGGVISSETKAKPKTGFNVFDFPSLKGSDPAVVGGGDVVAMFQDKPAARALIEYLATPEAAEIWAKLGGFSSPNKNVDESVYPDDITRSTASALAQAKVFRFDLSDLQPAAFGGDAMFTILQDFVKSPKDVDGTAKKLERAAAAAYKKS